MSRLSVVLVALVCLLGGALRTTLLRPAQPDPTAIRAIVDQALADRPPTPATDTMAELGPKIEDYLVANPMVLQRASTALRAQLAEQQRAATGMKIAAMSDTIFDDPDHIVIGNPKGDVTLVEMFDYNCTYCRASLPDLAQLIAEDPQLKIVLKEFPILTAGSREAARVGVVVSRSKADYWQFYQDLFSSRGEVTGKTAVAEAGKLGLNPFTIEAEAASPQVDAVIQKSFDIADALDITGTPTFIIGDEIIPGQVDINELRTRIANMRACGETVCGDKAS